MAVFFLLLIFSSSDFSVFCYTYTLYILFRMSLDWTSTRLVSRFHGCLMISHLAHWYLRNGFWFKNWFSKISMLLLWQRVPFKDWLGVGTLISSFDEVITVHTRHQTLPAKFIKPAVRHLTFFFYQRSILDWQAWAVFVHDAIGPMKLDGNFLSFIDLRRTGLINLRGGRILGIGRMNLMILMVVIMMLIFRHGVTGLM